MPTGLGHQQLAAWGQAGCQLFEQGGRIRGLVHHGEGQGEVHLACQVRDAERVGRAPARLDAIGQAGIEAFSLEGYHQTSSKKIARRAGVAVGSFYNHFRDKKALLMEIHRRHMTQVHAMVAQALKAADFGAPDTDGRALTSAIVQQTMQLHDLSPDLQRQIAALTYSDRDFAEMRRKEEAHAVEQVITLLSPHKDALRVTDLRAACEVVVQAIEAVVHGIRIFGAEDDGQAQLDALGDMIHRFLYPD